MAIKKRNILVLSDCLMHPSGSSTTTGSHHVSWDARRWSELKCSSCSGLWRGSTDAAGALLWSHSTPPPSSPPDCPLTRFPNVTAVLCNAVSVPKGAAGPGEVGSQQGLSSGWQAGNRGICLRKGWLWLTDPDFDFGF